MKLLCAFVALTVAAIASPASAQTALPGAVGPQLERVETLPAGLELARALVYTNVEARMSSAPPPQRFASATARLSFTVELTSDEPPDAEINYEVWSARGKVPIKDGYVSRSAVPAAKKWTVTFPLEPEVGPYADGAYQVRLRIGGKLVARLNWSVGDI